MTSPIRLDRLSALLEGVAPRVTVLQTEIGTSSVTFGPSSRQLLHLYLVAQGQASLSIPHATCLTINAPAIVVCRADTAHSLATVSGGPFEGLLCAKAFLDGPVAPLLLREFTQPLVVALDQAGASLNHVMHLIEAELLEPRCGQPALLERAGEILFIGLLRHLVAHPRASSGLFNGLEDPRIARALVAMHTAPQENWTLDKLAGEAGMSRTSFAVKFRAIVNYPPGKYLTQLRLSIALRAVQSGLGLKRAARDSGYASPTTLSRALSREARSHAIEE